MAERLFQPWIDTVADVLVIRNRAKALLAEGKTVMEWESSGVKSSKQFAVPIADVIRDCNWFLKTANPALYGRIIKRTTFDYTGS